MRAARRRRSEIAGGRARLPLPLDDHRPPPRRPDPRPAFDELAASSAAPSDAFLLYVHDQQTGWQPTHQYAPGLSRVRALGSQGTPSRRAHVGRSSTTSCGCEHYGGLLQRQRPRSRGHLLRVPVVLPDPRPGLRDLRAGGQGLRQRRGHAGRRRQPSCPGFVGGERREPGDAAGSGARDLQRRHPADPLLRTGLARAGGGADGGLRGAAAEQPSFSEGQDPRRPRAAVARSARHPQRRRLRRQRRR